MQKYNGPPCEEGQFYKTEENGHTWTHIKILGIDFVIEESVPITDNLSKILRKSAEHNIRRPVLVSAYGGQIGYSAALPDEIERIPPEHRRKVVVSGIETEILAASYDNTHTPVLTQEHVEQAAKEVWLHCAYVALAADEFPGPSHPDDFVIIFPDLITKYHQVTSSKSTDSS